jgi:prepilin-type N-terminal cleavage/methylation domain-containing protein
MRRNSGFTLIEILVVIAIIAAILGGISLMIGGAAKTKEKFATKSRVAALGLAIETLHGPDQLGMYPPTRMDMLVGPGTTGPVGKRLGVPTNDVNCGIETIYVALRLKGINVPTPGGFEGEDAIQNGDGDRAAEAVPDLQSTELYEYRDIWDNPLVYFSSRDYKDPKKVERYLLGNGQEVKVAPMRNARGEFDRPDSFQLFSIPGNDDDIPYGQ